ncbi:MAG: hypothetical protein ABI846_05070 [Rudaea sp.]
MSLLDDLEHEAQKRKASADTAQDRKAAREEFFKNQIDPRMSALGDYLTRLIAKLKALKPAQEWRYTLPGYGEIVAFSDHDYELVQSAQPDAREIRLTFGCTISHERSAPVEVEGIKVKALSGTFQRFNLSGQVSDAKKGPAGEILSAKFRARGRIALSATFNADADGILVRMNFRNFETLGDAHRTMSIGQLNEGLFDDIGRFVAHEENTLFREALSVDYREQLRSSVERNKVKQRWELKITDRRKVELAALQREHGGLLGRLKGLLDKGSV